MQHLRVVEKYRFLFLFVVMVLFFITKSLSTQLHYHHFTGYIFLILIIYSLYVISHKRGFLIFSALFTGIAEIILIFLDDMLATDALLAVKTFFAVLFFLVMTYACLLIVLHDKKISVTTLFGSLCAYFFIGLVWSYIYYFILVVEPGAFTGIKLLQNTENEFIYYSFVTLTTLGYGDVVPVSSIAKTMSWLEAYFGQAYLTVLMAQLVGRFISQEKG